jgi:hypothetical protein
MTMAETEIGGHAVGNVGPVGGTIVGTIEAPVILQEEAIGLGGVHDNLVHALTKLRIFFRHVHNADTAIPCVPRFAGIIGAINARGGNGYVHPIGVNRVEHDGVQSEAAVAGEPAWAMGMIEESAYEGPSYSIVLRGK